jgi:hypothetical protein
MLAWPWKKRQGESEPVENPMPNATVRANAPASPKSANPASPTPEAEPSKDPRIIAAEVVAEVDLEARIRKIRSERFREEADERAEKRKQADAMRFEAHYHVWLQCKADKQQPEQVDEQQNERCKVEAIAERAFFTVPSVYPDHVWLKIEAFEQVLSHELTIGQRTDSILLLALGAIKQDIINLDLFQ